jgi:hypothetical protein
MRSDGFTPGCQPIDSEVVELMAGEELGTARVAAALLDSGQDCRDVRNNAADATMA